MSKIKFGFSSALALALASQTVTPLLHPSIANAEPASAQASRSDRQELAALSETQKLALQMLIVSALVEKKAGELVQVDEKVAAKYNNMKIAYLGSVPATAVGGSAYYLGQESSKNVEFLIVPLTALVRASGRVLDASSNGIEKFLKVTGLDYVLRQSSNASEKSVDAVIKPILEVLVTKNTMLFSGASSTSSIFAGSVMFMMNNEREAMTWDQVRHLLGHDEIIRKRIDGTVSTVAAVFNLDPSQQAVLKQAIYDEVLRQAVANKFSTDLSKYSLDVVALMKQKQIISADIAEAVQKLRVLAGGLSNTESNEATRKLIEENLDSVLNLAAVLESQINAGKITDARDRAEVERMLGSLSAKLMLIGFNLKR